MTSKTEYPDVHALGKQLLNVWEFAFSGKAGREMDLPFDAMGRAASFGAAAYDACPMPDAASVAMMQAFLQALADPTDPRLDYLRAKNQPEKIYLSGVDAIEIERRRQIDVEGWTTSSDDRNNHCELALAGAVYALSGASDSDLRNKQRQAAIQELWPFQTHWFKATGGRSDLVKAGALIAAEIERLDRLEKSKEHPD